MTSNLVRRDLLGMEQRLRDSLYQVLPFESHAVYFPQSPVQEAPEWLPEEGKLLLPLFFGKEFLGVFMARHPDPGRVEAILPILPGIAALCLENLSLYKTGRLDPVTGLATKQVLLETLTREMENLASAFAGGGDEGNEDARPYSGSMGIIVVQFGGLSDIVRDTSYGFADRLAKQLAEAFRDALPEESLAARTGDAEYTVFLPDASRPSCEKLAATLVQQMEAIRLPDPLTGRQHGVRIHAGYALYPQDMDGTRQRAMDEQARRVLHKADLAAEVTRNASAVRLGRKIMGYSRLLYEGGRIRQVLPLSRALVTLGRSVGAREGQRFSVWSVNYDVQGSPSEDHLQPLYKGEIVLQEVRESEAVAEVLHLGDPAWPLEPGDDLTLLPEERSLSIRGNLSDGETNEEHGVPHRLDPLTGLYRYGDFLARLAKACNECEHFTLALVHVNLVHTEPGFNVSLTSAKEQPLSVGTSMPPDHLMAQVADQCRDAFASVTETSVLGGRFGLNSLVFFHAELPSPLLQKLYENICKESSERLGRRTGAGLACWPFLHFRPSDMLECARKALEYALLLPPPHVGFFDSLALNISADKRHCRGDVFGAIEEYKLALLADEDNALAWNSLGVCMASLGKHAEARHHFEEALRRTPDDPALTYNLGAVCQSLQDPEAAAGHFRACLKLAPTHLYAVIRLGQLAEAAGDLEEARSRFEAACSMNAQSALPFRHLARLALRLGKVDQAREHLHQALLRNPRDAIALSLMARLYLDGGEDPELAETLARQSVAQRPDRKNSWLVLARALEVQGRRSEAREALLKAGEL